MSGRGKGRGREFRGANRFAGFQLQVVGAEIEMAAHTSG